MRLFLMQKDTFQKLIEWNPTQAVTFVPERRADAKKKKKKEKKWIRVFKPLVSFDKSELVTSEIAKLGKLLTEKKADILSPEIG